MAVKDNLGGNGLNKDYGTVTFYKAEQDIAKNQLLQLKSGIPKDYYYQTYKFGDTSAKYKCTRISDSLYIFQSLTLSDKTVSVTYQLMRINADRLTFDEVDKVSDQYTFSIAPNDLSKLMLIRMSDDTFLEIIDARMVSSNSAGDKVQHRVIKIINNQIKLGTVHSYLLTAKGKRGSGSNCTDWITDGMLCRYNAFIDYEIVDETHILLCYNIFLSYNNTNATYYHFDTDILLLQISENDITVLDETISGIGRSYDYKNSSNSTSYEHISGLTNGFVSNLCDTSIHAMIIGSMTTECYILPFKIVNNKIELCSITHLPNGQFVISGNVPYIRLYNNDSSYGSSDSRDMPIVSIYSKDKLYILSNYASFGLTSFEDNTNMIKAMSNNLTGKAFTQFNMFSFSEADNAFILKNTEYIIRFNHYHMILPYYVDDVLHILCYRMGYTDTSSTSKTYQSGIIGAYYILDDKLMPDYPGYALSGVYNDTKIYAHQCATFNTGNFMLSRPIRIGYRSALSISLGTDNTSNQWYIIGSNTAFPMCHRRYNSKLVYTMINNSSDDTQNYLKCFYRNFDTEHYIYNDGESSIYGTYANKVKYTYGILFSKFYDPFMVIPCVSYDKFTSYDYDVCGIALNSAKAGEYVKVYEFIR